MELEKSGSRERGKQKGGGREIRLGSAMPRPCAPYRHGLQFSILAKGVNGKMQKSAGFGNALCVRSLHIMLNP
jgi:hypothetical protein